jgi:hypothetical protein
MLAALAQLRGAGNTVADMKAALADVGARLAEVRVPRCWGVGVQSCGRVTSHLHAVDLR